MNTKKLTITASFFVVFFLAFSVQSAYAHIPSYNPYGRQVEIWSCGGQSSCSLYDPYGNQIETDRGYQHGYTYADYCTDIKDYTWREKLCEGDLELSRGKLFSKIGMKQEVTTRIFFATEKAAKTNSKKACDELGNDLPEFAQIKTDHGIYESYEKKNIVASL